jgi:hypothetical protein
MSFLAPIFFVGLAAIAIPVLVHLIQRERKRVVEFPSLMFLRRIPYQSVRRRRIRNWLLLAMRAAALALIVAAFARPFVRQGPLAAAAVDGAREVVVLLDRSASMAWGDHWQRARTAARLAIDDLAPDDRATLVLFASSAEEHVRATTDRARIKAAVDAARVGSGATRYGPALKLAQSILGRSPLARREAILITDFQKSGWTGSEDVRFPEGTVLTPVSVASAETPNLSIPTVTFARTTFSGQERVAVTTGIINRSPIGISDLPVTLEIDGRTIETQPVGVASNASSSVVFAPFTVGEANMKGTVRAGSDQLPQDNAFDFVLTPGRPVDVLVIDSRDGRSARVDPSFYLTKALAIGTTPSFHVDPVAPAQVTLAQLDKHAIVVLNDVVFPSALGDGVLTRFVERGGGVLVILGEHSTWPAGDDAALLPGKLGPPVDAGGGGSGSLGFINYSHPIFELFKAPRSGDFSAARVFRYRALDTTAPGSDARVLARFDDGAVAAAERRVGAGRIIAFASTIDDSWNDLALKPVFLPLVHQTMRYLARYEEPASWYVVGQALDVTPRTASRAERVVLTPSGQRIPLSGAGAPRFVELEEQGFYEVRAKDAAKPALVVAVNLDPAESDLTSMDPRELVAAVTGRAVSDIEQGPPAAATPKDAERRQAIWWYLLFAGVVLLAAETVVSNRLSRRGAVV